MAQERQPLFPFPDIVHHLIELGDKGQLVPAEASELLGNLSWRIVCRQQGHAPARLRFR